MLFYNILFPIIIIIVIIIYYHYDYYYHYYHHYSLFWRINIELLLIDYSIGINIVF